MTADSMRPLVSQPANARAQVFLSHSSADRRIVDWVAAQIEAMGIDAYRADHDVQAGTMLAEKIRDAIIRSDALLALLTPQGDSSRYVHQEIGAARQVGKPVLVLFDRRVDPTSLAMLDGIEYISFDHEDVAASSADLIAAIRRLSELQGLPTPPVFVVNTQPAFQLQLSAQLQLNANQVLIGLLVLTAVAGLLYLAVNYAKEDGPGTVDGA
ncbi:MAG: toll/interleukin-1 receptor domain-containing protein [Ferrimicrobium sp.]|jgi:hypothetical protein|nr:toll/interleukin-1 receptor domain-containing protein [Ferrimicrobium sp.]